MGTLKNLLIEIQETERLENLSLEIQWINYASYVRRQRAWQSPCVTFEEYLGGQL